MIVSTGAGPNIDPKRKEVKLTRVEQKREERAILDAYLRLTRQGGIVEDGPEPPDFLLCTESKRIAVEVTGYHQPLRTVEGHTRREVEAAWEQIREHVVSYREDKPALDGLSVRLEFLSLAVPKTKEIAGFVQAVSDKITAAGDAIGKQTRRFGIDETDVPILRKYLKCFRVRFVECYMEWDWNHDFAGIGTSDEEMMLAIGKKLAEYKPPANVDESHLIVAGWGGHLSEVAAPIHEMQLNSFRNLSKALEASAFDCVAILCFRDFIWCRGIGWQPLAQPKSAA